MQLTEEIKDTLNETQSNLSGYERRHFMAQIVESVFDGEQTHAEHELGWNRKTLRKALSELRNGFCYIDNYHKRGRKRIDIHLSNLEQDIREFTTLQKIRSTEISSNPADIGVIQQAIRTIHAWFDSYRVQNHWQ